MDIESQERGRGGTLQENVMFFAVKYVYSVTKDDVTKAEPPQVYFKPLNRPPEDKYLMNRELK